MKHVYVAKTPHEKNMQRALLQWKRPDKRRLVIEALKEAGREDLIGYGKECLVRPLNDARRKPQKQAAPEKPQRKYGKVYGRAETAKPRHSGEKPKPGKPHGGGKKRK